MEPSEARGRARGPDFCEVALPRPLLQTFTYRLPPELRPEARPGVRALVPFGRREVVGCIASLHDETDLERVRPVLDLLDDRPLLPPALLRLCFWVAEYYVAPPGLVIRAALPPGLFAETTYRVRLEGDPAALDPETLTAGERAALERLAAAEGPLRVTTLRRAMPSGSAWPALRALARKGLVSVEEREPDAGTPALERQVVRLTRRLPTLTAREEAFGRAARQREAYELLESMGGEAPVAHLTGQLGFSRSVVHGLVEKRIAKLEEERVIRDPLRELGEAAVGESPRRPTPTPAQADVIEGLRRQAAEPEPGVALLRGVTGSGKTLVYLELMESLVAEEGRSAIVLVPEISLTPQTLARFRSRFGDLVAVLHSGLSAGERYDEWRALREGEKRIAVGARSAAFAPVPDLGLIVLDEEHEGSYKQSETPRYHARAVAAMRARLEGCLCLLGSATPSLESWANAGEERYRLYELPERVTGQALPRVELLDLRAEREARREAGPAAPVKGAEAAEQGSGAAEQGAEAAEKGSEAAERGSAATPRPSDGGPLVFTRRLADAIADRLERGEQTILLLNRRGYATFVQCEECGKVWSCGRCNVSLTYHRRRRRVVCHHCGFETEPPARCDECGGPEPSYAGVGTEQVERRLGELFPGARLARMDLDTTATKWAHFEILDRMRRGEVDVLLGTQMIAKGHDYPGVTLVGVINADVGLNLPDFRASERTFQLLSQVAGRAGRGTRPGEVLVQTARPDHFALRAAATHDFLTFAAREMRDRREPGYPPHRRLANLVISGPREESVAEEAAELADWMRELVAARGLADLEVVGPAPCPIDRLRDRWRWHFLLKADDAVTLGSALRYLAERRGQPSGEVRLEIDRDPEALL